MDATKATPELRCLGDDALLEEVSRFDFDGADQK